jgi:hypothetical protein
MTMFRSYTRFLREAGKKVTKNRAKRQKNVAAESHAAPMELGQLRIAKL